MTTTLDPPEIRSQTDDDPEYEINPEETNETASTDSDVRTGGRTLRREMTAVRLSFHWPGTTKTLTPHQKATAADAFGATGRSISAGKKLIDTSHPKWKACTAVRSQAQKFWTGLTLPWPEPGIRLIRRSDVAGFDGRMRELQDELSDAAAELESEFEQIKAQAADRLGDLFDPGDYPARIAAAFAVAWDFPSVEAPDYLKTMCPEIYREEQRRVAARFEEAVRLAEAAFAEELSGLVEHLAERLSGADDGKPKVFRDSAVENFREFFDRFSRLNVTGAAGLEQVVHHAESLLSGTSAEQLRSSSSVRRSVSAGLARVQSSLDGLMVDRPRRRVLRG